MPDDMRAAFVIMCATTRAAAEVLVVLCATHLRPGHDFRIAPDLAIAPQIAFTLTAEPPAVILDQLWAIPETTIT